MDIYGVGLIPPRKTITIKNSIKHDKFSYASKKVLNFLIACEAQLEEETRPHVYIPPERLEHNDKHKKLDSTRES